MSSHVADLERQARARFAARPDVLKCLDFLMGPPNPALGGPLNESDLEEVREGWLEFALSLTDSQVDQYEKLIPMALASADRIIKTGSKC